MLCRLVVDALFCIFSLNCALFVGNYYILQKKQQQFELERCATVNTVTSIFVLVSVGIDLKELGGQMSKCLKLHRD